MEFFNKTFEEQVNLIIESNDLKLLQVFIGIRNPIALLQYYSSFICTKIALLDTELHGFHKFQLECLRLYEDNSYNNNRGKTIDSVTKSATENVKKELLANLLLPINKSNIELDSVCNLNYTHSKNLDGLVAYVRNTEISNICCMNIQHIEELYESYVSKAKESLKNIKVEDKIFLLHEIESMNFKISKYKNSLNTVKNREFLTDWYVELCNKVKVDAKKGDHVLKDYLPKGENEQKRFITILKVQYAKQIAKVVLESVVGKTYNKKEGERFIEFMQVEMMSPEKLDYDVIVSKVKNKLREKIDCGCNCKVFNLVIENMKACTVMKAEQTVLDSMLHIAITQKKLDSVLLLVCNGANVNLLYKCQPKDKKPLFVCNGAEVKVLNEWELQFEEIIWEKKLKEKLQMPAFVLIENLYKHMPVIKAMFNCGANLFDHCALAYPHKLCGYKELDLENIFDVTDIQETFKGSSVEKIASCLSTNEDEKVLNKKIKELKEIIAKIDKTTVKDKCKEFMEPFWNSFFTFTFLGVPLLGYLLYDGVKSWSSRRYANDELEIANKDIANAVTLFEHLLSCLQCTIVAGKDIFKEKIECVQYEIEIIKKNKEKFVNISNVISAFEDLQASERNFFPDSVKFSTLAGDIIRNKMKMFELNEQNNDTGPSFPYVEDSGKIVLFKDLSEAKAGFENLQSERLEKEKKAKESQELLLQLLKYDMPIYWHLINHIYR